VTSDAPRPITTCDTQNRTPVTYATNVTGVEGKRGRGLDAVGGCFPPLRHLSQSVTVTERNSNLGGHWL